MSQSTFEGGIARPVNESQRLSIQAILNKVGRRLVGELDWLGQPKGVVGIHVWTYETKVEIQRMKSAGKWEGEVPNEPTLRRRCNYMADSEWIDEGIPREPGDSPKWMRLPLQIRAANNWNGNQMKMQPAYRLVEEER